MKKAVVILLCALVGVMSVAAKERQTREEYVEKYKAIAIAHMERYGIPASITMAQGILESDSGNSYLSRTSNNHFGIKCKKSWTGRKVYHDDDAKGECFRAYPSVEASYQTTPTSSISRHATIRCLPTHRTTIAAGLEV